MVCVCCVEKNLREDDKDDAEEEDVYFGDQHNGGRVGGDLNVERLTTVRNITGGVEWRKKTYVLKMKLHFEKTLCESVLFF